MNPVKIGWSKREISMEGPVSIPGQMYMRISKGIRDPLYATVLLMDGGAPENSVIFCSMDVTVISAGLTAMVTEMVHKTHPQIPMETIIFNATHTHSSMNYWSDSDTTVSGEPMLNGLKTVRPYIASKVAEAICEAWDNRAQGGIAYGYGYAVVGHSRRVCYMVDLSERSKNLLAAAPNGHAAMYGNTNDKDFSHYEAGADHFLNVLFTFDSAEKLTGVIVNVPCPSQTSEHFTELSADYWHDVRELMAKEFGPDVFVLTQCAAAGDLSPRILHYREAQVRRMRLKYGLEYDPKQNQGYNKAIAERYDIAERIVTGVKEVYGWAKKDIKKDFPVRHVHQTLPLTRRLVTDEEYAECKQRLIDLETVRPDPEGLTQEEYRKKQTNFDAIRNRSLRAMDRYEKQGENPTMDVYLHVVQIDQVGFSTTRFELYQDFMHRLQARSPFLQTFVVQMGGDEQSTYLPTQRGMDNKGYSASLFCNEIGAVGGQEWVETSLAIMQKMKDQDEA